MSTALQERLTQEVDTYQVVVPPDEAYPLGYFVTTVAQTLIIPDRFDRNEFTDEVPLFGITDFIRAKRDGNALVQRLVSEQLQAEQINGVLESLAILVSLPTENGLPIWSFGVIETLAFAQAELRRIYPTINFHHIIGESHFAPRNHPDLSDEIRVQFGFDRQLTGGGSYAGGSSGTVIYHKNGSSPKSHTG